MKIINGTPAQSANLLNRLRSAAGRSAINKPITEVKPLIGTKSDAILPHSNVVFVASKDTIGHDVTQLPYGKAVFVASKDTIRPDAISFRYSLLSDADVLIKNNNEIAAKGAEALEKFGISLDKVKFVNNSKLVKRIFNPPTTIIGGLFPYAVKRPVEETATKKEMLVINQLRPKLLEAIKNELKNYKYLHYDSKYEQELNKMDISHLLHEFLWIKSLIK